MLTRFSTKIRQLMLLLIAICLASTAADAQKNWVGSWASSQQLVEPHNSISSKDLHDVTLRQIVHLTIGGSELRLRLSNRYGSDPLHIDSVHVARPVATDSGRLVPNSDQPLTFSGRQDVTIPANADYLSDPIAYPVVSSSDLAITIHIQAMPANQTGHPGSRATSYLAHGDHVTAVELADAKPIEHWYFIAAIDVVAPARAVAVITLGDSITDGHGATTNGNDRWPDVLARRLQASAHNRWIAVLNHGIGGNRLLLHSLGPNALARFDDDVIAQSGARYLIVLEGINDIGMLGRTPDATPAEHEELVRNIIAAYQQIVARAHTHRIKVAGATILPFAGSSFYHPEAQGEADRQAVNKWIRMPGHFDTVIDFDQIVRDPRSPDRLLPKFDSGDHLHPSPAGYSAMGKAVPLSFFTYAAGPTSRQPQTHPTAPRPH
jgi:lysophospholipase L1-like esterase